MKFPSFVFLHVMSGTFLDDPCYANALQNGGVIIVSAQITEYIRGLSSLITPTKSGQYFRLELSGILMSPLY